MFLHRNPMFSRLEVGGLASCVSARLRQQQRVSEIIIFAARGYEPLTFGGVVRGIGPSAKSPVLHLKVGWSDLALLVVAGRSLVDRRAGGARFFDVELACMKPHFDAALALGAFGGGAVADVAGLAGAVASGSGGACYWAIDPVTQ